MSLEHMLRDEQEAWSFLLDEAQREGEFEMTTFTKGQRVEIVDGVLQGEKATVTGDYEDKGFVLLSFDRKDAVLDREKGYAILSDQWVEISRLRRI